MSSTPSQDRLFVLARRARAQGKLPAAELLARRVTAAHPDDPDGWRLLGEVLAARGRADDAVQAFDRAGDGPTARLMRGLELASAGALLQAEAELQAALAAGLDAARVHLGAVLLRMGEPDAVLRLCADRPDTPAEAALAMVARQCSEAVLGRRLPWPAPVAPSEEQGATPLRRIVLWTTRPRAALTTALLAHAPAALERQGASVTVLIDAPIPQDEAGFEVTTHLSDQAFDARLSELAPDVLLDLDGAYALGRRGGGPAGLLDRRRAPLQAVWTGSVDLADGTVHDGLVDLAWVGPPPGDLPPLTPPPSLLHGHLTWGLLAHPACLGPSVRRVLQEILDARPDDRVCLLLDEGGPDEHARWTSRLADAGTAPEQVSVRTAVDRATRRAWLSGVDVVVDGWPCSSLSGTLDALWMGVVVLTRPSDRRAGALAADLLRAIGRPEDVAADEPDQVRRALALAADADARLQARRSLRQTLAEAPQADPDRAARALLDAIDALAAG